MTHLLDQFCDGLKKAGLLDIIRMFADQFLPLFVYTKLTAADVLAAVYVSAEQKSNPEHEVLLGYFNRFILECDETGNYVCKSLLSDNLLPLSKSFQHYLYIKVIQ